MKKTRVVEAIDRAIDEAGAMFDLTLYEDCEILITKIVQDLDLSFDYCLRDGGMDSWAQVEYYSNNLGKTIIWDYDAPLMGDIEDTVEYILNLEKEITRFEKKLPKLKN